MALIQPLHYFKWLQKKISQNTLKIYTINVNSIVAISRRAYLMDFLAKNNPDIVLLCETKLNKINKISFKKYNFIRHDRRDAIQGGGTAILIKKCFSYTCLNSPTIENFLCLETSIISISLPQNNRLYIVSAYAPGRSGNQFQDELEMLFEKLRLNDLSNYYLIAGDLNAKHVNWSNAVNNPRGVFLNSWITDSLINFRCKLLASSTPTFPSSGSFLDLCIADTRLCFHNKDGIINDTINPILIGLEVFPYASDHFALYIEISYEKDSPFIIHKHEEKSMYNFNNTNWIRLQAEIVKRCNLLEIDSKRNLTNDEIDKGFIELQDICLNAIQRIVPKIKSSNSTSSFITPEIKLLQNYKRKTISKLFEIYRSNSSFHSD